SPKSGACGGGGVFGVGDAHQVLRAAGHPAHPWRVAVERGKETGDRRGEAESRFTFRVPRSTPGTSGARGISARLRVALWAGVAPFWQAAGRQLGREPADRLVAGAGVSYQRLVLALWGDVCSSGFQRPVRVRGRHLFFALGGRALERRDGHDVPATMEL